MAIPKMGQRVVYTGPLATAADMEALGVAKHLCRDTDPPPPGTVMGFRGILGPIEDRKVTVLLDKQEGETEDLYADWPIEEVAPA